MQAGCFQTVPQGGGGDAAFVVEAADIVDTITVLKH